MFLALDLDLDLDLALDLDLGLALDLERQAEYLKTKVHKGKAKEITRRRTCSYPIWDRETAEYAIRAGTDPQ